MILMQIIKKTMRKFVKKILNPETVVDIVLLNSETQNNCKTVTYFPF